MDFVIVEASFCHFFFVITEVKRVHFAGITEKDHIVSIIIHILTLAFDRALGISGNAFLEAVSTSERIGDIIVVPVISMTTMIVSPHGYIIAAIRQVEKHQLAAILARGDGLLVVSYNLLSNFSLVSAVLICQSRKNFIYED